MENLLRSGIAWLGSQLKANASSWIAYEQGSNAVDILATIGRHVPANAGTIDGAEVDTFSTVFTFDRVDLDFGGGPVEPQRGDVIRFEDNGTTFVFEVMPTDDGRHWKQSDAFGERLEVAAKLTGRTT